MVCVSILSLPDRAESKSQVAVGEICFFRFSILERGLIRTFVYLVFCLSKRDISEDAENGNLP